MQLKKDFKNTIFVIDAHSFLHRAYHALPKLTSNNMEVGALYGFVRFLLNVLKKEPGYIAVCFDSPGKTFRHKLFPAYKANRPKTDDALVEQLKQSRQVTTNLGLAVIAKEGYEADDLLAFLAEKAQKENLNTVLVTSDKDSYQMVNDKVSIWTGGKEDMRGAAYVKEKFGVMPSQIADYLAIVGDSIDNISGIKGIGAKTAAKLLNDFSSLDNIIKEAENKNSKIPVKTVEKILEDKENAVLSKQLTLLSTDIALEVEIMKLKSKPMDEEGIEKIVKKYGFKSLLANVKPKTDETVNLTPCSWRETVKKISDNKQCFIQASGGFLILATDEKTFTLKEISNITSEEKTFLNNLISDFKILKISYDLKSTISKADLFFEKGTLINCFDFKLAAYCLNPSINYDFTSIVLEYLGEVITTTDEQKLLIIQNTLALKLKEKLNSLIDKNGLSKLYYDMEIPVLSVLSAMENAGMKVDFKELEALKKTLESAIEQLQKEINTAAGGYINVNSPKQLSEFLFDKMKITPLKKIKTGYSTNEDVLTELAPKYDIADKILQFRQAVKLKSTYVENLLELSDKNTQRIHTYLDQTKTATGRLSSLKPNLQNIPTNSEIQKVFKAKKGYALLFADYSQIDLRVLAHESGDKILLEAFKNNEDIHTKTAAEVFGVIPALVTFEMRKRAKAINFGIVYGQTGIGLSSDLKIPLSEAKEYIEHYFNTYKGVKEWIDKTRILAKEQGYVKTLGGRIRYLPELKATNKHTVFAAERAAVNTVIQGGSADIIKLAMIEIYKELKNYNADMLMQLHDELIFEVSKTMLDKFAVLVKDKMQSAVKLKVPLVVDIKTGENWKELKPLK